MLGIAPKNHFMTSQQRDTSSEISESIPSLPTALSDLISQMAVPDFSVATEKPELDEDGAVIQNERNLQITATIELALSTTSAACRPAMKAQIFYNAVNSEGGSSRSYLVQIIRGMRDRGVKINLDGVELHNLDTRKIGPLVLDGMSAQKALFSHVYLWHASLYRADFRDTRFIKSSLGCVNLSYADITGATFTDVEFLSAEVSGLTGNQSDLFGRDQPYAELVTTECTPYFVEKRHLNESDVSAIPDTNPFTLAAEKSWAPMQR